METKRMVMALACMLNAACGDDTDFDPVPRVDATPRVDAAPRIDAAPPPGANAIRITQIQVTDEVDGIGLLDMEVHLFDADNGRFMGCSGQYHGLENVDESDVLYPVDAHFVLIENDMDRDLDPDEWVSGTDVQDRNIQIVVIEDDQLRCPEPFGPADDIVGISESIPGSMLLSLQQIAFGDVTRLTIGIPDRITQ